MTRLTKALDQPLCPPKKTSVGVKTRFRVTSTIVWLYFQDNSTLATVGRDTLLSRIFNTGRSRSKGHTRDNERRGAEWRSWVQAPPRIAPLHEVHEELSRDAAARDDVTPETGDPSHNHGQADRCPREYGAREAEMVTFPERRRTLSRGLHARARVSCPSCSNQLCRARPCSRIASSLQRPCDTTLNSQLSRRKESR